jgi:hypothetical protein
MSGKLKGQTSKKKQRSKGKQKEAREVGRIRINEQIVIGEGFL